MQPFVFNTTKSIVFRPGASADLAGVAGKLIGDRVLFVTDPGLRRLGLCDKGLASLQDAGHEVIVFDEVEADPSRATLEKAVELASQVARSGETVLLSPACASFDQFRDFEERGDRFRTLVRALGDTGGMP